MSVMIGQASIDERGSISGGAAGDQGRELNTRGWYDGGWTLLLRFRDRQAAKKAAQICKAVIASRNPLGSTIAPTHSAAPITATTS